MAATTDPPLNILVYYLHNSKDMLSLGVVWCCKDDGILQVQRAFPIICPALNAVLFALIEPQLRTTLNHIDILPGSGGENRYCSIMNMIWTLDNFNIIPNFFPRILNFKKIPYEAQAYVVTECLFLLATLTHWQRNFEGFFFPIFIFSEVDFKITSTAKFGTIHYKTNTCIHIFILFFFMKPTNIS